MAPGPKKKSFHTPRNKNNQNYKANDTKVSDLSNEASKTIDAGSALQTDSEITGNKKYSKRSIESNWNKYEEPSSDPHADSAKGHNFEVLASYSGGSGTQFKFQVEKDWEDEDLNIKDISLNFQDLINALKCIPLHERINVKNIFDEKHIQNFVSVAEKWETNYESQPKAEAIESKDNATAESEDSTLTIIEEADSTESDDFLHTKSYVVQDKTTNIINSLASNLTFKELPEKEVTPDEPQTEAFNNDLDFLLSLNISSKVSAKEESSEIPKNSNVDDWLNSILDD